jgi:hypothetical protein
MVEQGQDFSQEAKHLLKGNFSPFPKKSELFCFIKLLGLFKSHAPCLINNKQ